MAVLQMQRISICALKKNRKAILEKLQSLGVMEISDLPEEDSLFGKSDTTSAKAAFEKNAMAADQALEILNAYAPEKTSMLSSLEGKQLVDKDHFEKLVADKEGAVSFVNRLLSLNKQVAEYRANIQKLESQIEALTPWLPLDVPMIMEGTARTKLFVGTLSSPMDLTSVYTMIGEHAPELERCDVNILSADRNQTYLTVMCMKEDSARMEEALRAGGFAKPAQMIRIIPAEQKQRLKQQIAELKDSAAKVEAEIISYSKDREDIRIIADYYRSRAAKYEVLGRLPQSKNTFIITGYAPENVIPVMEKAVGEKYDAAIDIEEISEEEDYPIKLKNNAYSESVEGVLSSYGLPQRHELDPTAIMSFFYVFFFGLMLSDAAYGAILAVVCFAVIKKYPRMNANMRKTMKMFMFCGISTLFWGILFGGYFGDIVDVVSASYFGKQITVPALWLVPLDNPMRLLLFSLLFGTIHLFTGLVIKGYITLKDKAYMDFLCDVLLWFFLLVGLLIMLIPSDIFASIAQMEFVFPDIVNTIGKWLAIIGAVGIILMNGRSSKNPVIRLLLGVYDLYNVTGWLSDVLSYSRLLALGLATGVIAQVFNQIGSMFASGIFGTIIFIVIFIIGTVFNLAINLLGAYVHTNRLQYVEFFGKFYEGGGRPFNPFTTNTKYVDIKEETYS